MTKSKYGKYICTELKPETIERDRNSQGTDRTMQHIISLDNKVIPGAMYAECVWFNPGYLDSPEVMRKQEGLATHTHPFDEVLAFFGTDINDPYNLGGEIELWLEDEKFELKNSFMAFIPAGMRHCPMKTISIDRRMFHFTLGPGKEYTKTASDIETPVKKNWDVRKHIITGLKE
jgi:mannose-6-phosphate isomerase-like protein (cupin superfamily)